MKEEQVEEFQEAIEKETEKCKSVIDPNKVEEKPSFTKWDYGHLIRECNRCGHKTIMDRDVEDGLSFHLPTTDKHEIKLVCENCGNSMRVYFIKSDKVKPPKEEEKEPVNEELVVDKKVKRRKVKKDDISKDSKEEKSVSTDS